MPNKPFALAFRILPVVAIISSGYFGINAFSQRFEMIKVAETNQYGGAVIKNQQTQRLDIDYTLSAKDDQQSNNLANCENLKRMPLQLGQSGSVIKDVQQCMQNDGFYTWPLGITGYFGNYTKDNFYKWVSSKVQEIKALQPQNQPKQAPEIVPTLGQKQPPTNDSKNDCTTLKYKPWKFGQSSEAVKNLQVCMQSEGFFKHEHGATGYFGEVTKKALIEWILN